MVFIKSKRKGLKIPKFGLEFGSESLEVSEKIAEVLLREEGMFELLEGSKLKTKTEKNKKKKKEGDE